MSKRSQWASSIGFILATAGAAIGLGNLWKFPYLMGKNGGFFFLVAYLVFVVILGLPVMITEMAIGRYTQRDPVGAFRAIGKRTVGIGILAVLAAGLILSYYSVIGGWLIKYCISYLTTFQAPADFSAYIAQAGEPVLWHFVFMAITGFICYKGTKGIEKASGIMMPALFVLLLVIIARSLTLEGAGSGLAFVFLPSASAFNLSSISAALGQVFYSLSLGMGITLTYGSYLNKKENIPQNCLRVAALDTAVAVMAGIAIFPAVFAFGLEPGQGPGLIFGTLPHVFAEIPGGSFFAILFFVLMLFAAVTSAIALLECIIAFAIDNLKWSRRTAVLILGGLVFLLGIPSSLSFGAISSFKILNYDFFSFIGMITDNILMPLGGILTCVYVGWFWGPEKLAQEMEKEGNTFRLKKAWLGCIRFITPVLIIIVTLMGFMDVYQIITGA